MRGEHNYHNAIRAYEEAYKENPIKFYLDAIDHAKNM